MMPSSLTSATDLQRLASLKHTTNDDISFGCGKTSSCARIRRTPLVSKPQLSEHLLHASPSHVILIILQTLDFRWPDLLLRFRISRKLDDSPPLTQALVPSALVALALYHVPTTISPGPLLLEHADELCAARLQESELLDLEASLETEGAITRAAELLFEYSNGIA